MLTSIAAAMLALATASGTPGGLESGPVAIAVSTADIDLTTSRDIARLDRRIRSAVKDVCGSATSGDLVGQNRVANCREKTLAAIKVQRDVRIAATRALPSADRTLSMR